MPGETKPLTDIGTEELAFGNDRTICSQLLKGADCETLKACGYDPACVSWLRHIPNEASGVPFTAATYNQGILKPPDENLAAEQKPHHI